MSSIGDLIKKEYEKKFDEKKEEVKKKSKVKRIESKSSTIKRTQSIIETNNMRRISFWLDKDLYDEIQVLIEILDKDPLGKTYSNESELIRNLIRKGLPYLQSDFKRMFPHLIFSNK